MEPKLKINRSISEVESTRTLISNIIKNYIVYLLD